MLDRRWCLGMVLLLALAAVSPGEPAKPLASKSSAKSAAPDALAMAARIDKLLAEKWAADEVQPAAIADDYEFCRRVHLDLAGRIPTVQEIRIFVADQSPDKRTRLIDKLLDSGSYVRHFTTFWRSLLLGGGPNDAFNRNFFSNSFENWLRSRLHENAPYDKMVREILTAQRQSRTGRQGEGDPSAFFQVNENKPETVAAAASRLFLGVKIECAQCHNHPFARWTREQFWEFAAFFNVFGRVDPRTGRQQPGGNGREIPIPESDVIAKARFLDGTEPDWKDGKSSLVILSDWLLTPENPFFAKAAVNRMWTYFFGVGLVEPVDDLNDNNPPSHPEIFNELAKAFAASGFDLKFLMRVITNTRAYQLTSRQTHESQEDPRYYAKMSVRGMSAEQLFDSIVQATYTDPADANRQVPGLFGQQTARAEFIARFSNLTDKPTEYQTAILQALLLMNGELTNKATSVEESMLLHATAEMPLWNSEKKVEVLYLATLSRKPTAKEAKRLSEYVERGGVSGDKKKALADVFWALLNSGEFILNR